jgi:hypothetical protein
LIIPFILFKLPPQTELFYQREDPMPKTVTITLTLPQLHAVLDAVSQMTDGNARDWDEMKKCGIVNPRVLVAAEDKLLKARDRLTREAS